MLVLRIAAGGSGKCWLEAKLPLEKSALGARLLICEALIGNSFSASKAEVLDSFSRSLQGLFAWLLQLLHFGRVLFYGYLAVGGPGGQKGQV